MYVCVIYNNICLPCVLIIYVQLVFLPGSWFLLVLVIGPLVLFFLIVFTIVVICYCRYDRLCMNFHITTNHIVLNSYHVILRNSRNHWHLLSIITLLFAIFWTKNCILQKIPTVWVPNKNHKLTLYANYVTTKVFRFLNYYTCSIELQQPLNMPIHSKLHNMTVQYKKICSWLCVSVYSTYLVNVCD